MAYLSRRVIGWWETLSNMTGGAAYLLVRGRRSPRQIQRSAGLLTTKAQRFGTLSFAALLPVLLITAMENQPRSSGALYIEATKTS